LDEPFLWETLYHALYVPEGNPPFPKDIVNSRDIAKYVFGWGKVGDQGFVAIDETSGLPVGAVWIRLFESANHGYGFVAEDIPELSIALLPGHRNSGIGTQLLRHMIIEAATQFPGLSLSVGRDNPARRLYERLGFQLIKENGTSLTMLLKLRSLDSRL